MNTNSSLIAELRDKSYRDAYVASQIKIGLPLQIRALRMSRGWTQGELATRAGMSQPRIAEIEKGKRSLNLDTLLRLASAFDVGLDVFFASFGELIDRRESFDPDDFAVQAFDQEVQAAEAATDQGSNEDGLRAALELVKNTVTASPNKTKRQTALEDAGRAAERRLVFGAPLELVPKGGASGAAATRPPIVASGSGAVAIPA